MAQSPLISRRSVLLTGAVAGTASLSGCALLWEVNENALEELSVYVYNETEERHRFDIRLLEEEGTTVYEGIFELEPGERGSGETDVTGGTEYRVLVRVDGGEVLEGTYHWGGCRVDRAEVYIRSGTEFDVRGTNSCD